MAEEVEQAAGQNNTKRLYEITRILSGRKNTNLCRPIKNKNDSVITGNAEQRSRWVEHFDEILNRPPPTTTLNITPASEQLLVNTNPPTKAEIIKAIKSLNSGKAAGPDGIPAEALKVDPTSALEMLHPLLQKTWEQELSPTIFLIVIDWIMRRTTFNSNTGVQWTFDRQLEDLDFAGDTSLLSHK
ncbi:uncharacterized protein LOC112565890 [Pomacea canaliculata]|uniref:uncharacterized protein LOC112565890 n=1 Tax=Pomacea canaliculata TaxID=400727 RepID=UPI000D7394B0|nr:uncharacterized protein LOC112565890 [Pomacea canaliculata]